jgi:hypothetical protein
VILARSVSAICAEYKRTHRVRSKVSGVLRKRSYGGERHLAHGARFQGTSGLVVDITGSDGDFTVGYLSCRVDGESSGM